MLQRLIELLTDNKLLLNKNDLDTLHKQIKAEHHLENVLGKRSKEWMDVYNYLAQHDMPQEMLDLIKREIDKSLEEEFNDTL